jgi:hypothetical protein
MRKPKSYSQGSAVQLKTSRFFGVAGFRLLN